MVGRGAGGYTGPMVLTLLLLASGGCGGRDVCAERADDGDCDGVPDGWDRCLQSPEGLVDREGCAPEEAAGCAVLLREPADGARVQAPARLQWTGTCEVYLVQLSDDPGFPAAATRTAARTGGLEAEVAGTERYWRVQGGLRGRSAGASTPGRRLRWR